MLLNTSAYKARLSAWSVLLLVLLPVTLPAYSEGRDDRDAARQMNAVIDAVKPALVRIHVISAEHYQGREIKEESVGSGVIISKQGHVVTNHHVAGHAKRIICTMADKTEIDAELIGADPMSDIAVIRLLPSVRKDFPTAKFGDSSTLKVGDRVLAMGSPLAFSQSATLGIVSNTELVIPKFLRWLKLTLDGEDVGSIVRWIAHDADIYPGNSGGPLVNLNGEIVGINEIALGLSGAIPGNLAKAVAEQLVKHGKVRRSWLGIGVQPLLKSTEDKRGVLVSSVIEGSPADEAGLKAGDILIRIDGKDCSVRFPEELPVFNQFALNLPSGKETEAVVRRDGKEITLKITPTERQEARSIPGEMKQWGICASNITLFTAKEMKRAHTKGVLVANVRPGGPCGSAKPAISADDVITEVAGRPINSLDDLRAVTQEITAGKEEPVPTIVAFDRGTDKYLTVVKVGIQDLKDPGREVRKAWLPAGTQVLTRDIAEALGLKGQKGVRVTQVYPKTAAEKADLHVGDIIVALDGTPIPASEPEDTEVLPAMIRQYRIGSSAEFTVLRDGKEEKISIELPPAPELPREMKKYRDDNFEFTVRDIAFLDRVEKQLPEGQTGVLVESVGEGGWASVGGVSTGDIIISVDSQVVQDVPSFEKLMEQVATSKSKTIVLQVKRGIHNIFVELEPAWSS